MNTSFLRFGCSCNETTAKAFRKSNPSNYCRLGLNGSIHFPRGGEVEIKKALSGDIMKALGGEVEISITSQCPNIARLKEATSKGKISEAMTLPNRNIKKANETLPHSACHFLLQ